MSAQQSQEQPNSLVAFLCKHYPDLIMSFTCGEKKSFFDPEYLVRIIPERLCLGSSRSAMIGRSHPDPVEYDWYLIADWLADTIDTFRVDRVNEVVISRLALVAESRTMDAIQIRMTDDDLERWFKIHQELPCQISQACRRLILDYRSRCYLSHRSFPTLSQYLDSILPGVVEATKGVSINCPGDLIPYLSVPSRQMYEGIPQPAFIKQKIAEDLWRSYLSQKR